MSDYETEDITCPKCQHFPIHWRHCKDCDLGFVETDDYLFCKCVTCAATGIERWCPGCGTDLSGIALEEKSENPNS